MKKLFVISFLAVIMMSMISLTQQSLRKIYSKSPDKWPVPLVDAGVDWKELGKLPAGPLQHKLDSFRYLIELGKVLFFDPRLSGSGKISCASCHQPELSWTDGKERSIGHDSTVNKRNSPTIQNSWFYSKLFWDGRARDLEDQVFAPINSESEMHGDMRELPFKLRRIKGYAPLFDAAYGDPQIDPDRIANAIAIFERSIVSSKSRFDEFLEGNKKALSKSELSGLHLFRTKAKCMNCHNGPMFTDNQFHRSIFISDDEGLYKVSHKNEDRGKFKTPSLRDVMQTGPWGHNGTIKHMLDILFSYNKSSPSPTSHQQQMLFLSPREISDLLAFLQSISSPPTVFQKPTLPE
jgi:cytochrome c peroxidase